MCTMDPCVFRTFPAGRMFHHAFPTHTDRLPSAVYEGDFLQTQRPALVDIVIWVAAWLSLTRVGT